MSTSSVEKELLKKFLKLNGEKFNFILKDLAKNREAWQNFKKVLCNNIKYCNSYRPLHGLQKVEINNRIFLVIKLQSWDYLIIDLLEGKVLKKSEVEYWFDKEYFLDNFQEKEEKFMFLNTCHSVYDIVNVFYRYENYLLSDASYFYHVENDNSTVDLEIDLITDCCHVNFYSNKLDLEKSYYFTSNLESIDKVNEKNDEQIRLVRKPYQNSRIKRCV